MTGQLNHLSNPNLDKPVMIVGWRNDAGKLTERIVPYIVKELGMIPLAEIQPTGYFPLTSVEVISDLVRFPCSKFHCSDRPAVITFESDVPLYEVHEFVKNVLDLASIYDVSRLITINGLPVMASHNTPVKTLANASSVIQREWLESEEIDTGINFELPAGQKPPISAYLMWEARQRGIEAVSLWIQVPFYLSALEYKGGIRRFLEFLKTKVGLPIDTENAEAEENLQRSKLGELRSRSAEVDKYFSMMESNLSLTDYEAGQLATEVRRAFGLKTIENE